MFPPHVNIFYCFGGLVLTCFLIQVATGFAMTFYYQPSVVDAFASVEYIMTSVNFGWLIRSLHRWSASMMVLMLVLHVFRVYLTGGFQKTSRIDMGNRCNFICCYGFIWGNRLFITMGIKLGSGLVKL